MRNKLPRMKLSRDEEAFIRRWIYDEVHFQEGTGPAKRLQVLHQVRPADLALLIAAALPNTADQEAASCDPHPEKNPLWPWSEREFLQRIEEARTLLGLSPALQPSPLNAPP
jgi:hypothetical protein